MANEQVRESGAIMTTENMDIVQSSNGSLVLLLPFFYSRLKQEKKVWDERNLYAKQQKALSVLMYRDF